MDLSFVVKQLRAAGAHVEIPSEPNIDLRVNGHPAEVKAYHSDPRRAQLNRARETAAHGNRPLVVQVERISPELAELATRERRIVVVSTDEVILDGQRVTLVEGKPPTRSKRGPRPYTRFAVGRALLAAGRATTQQHLASLAGVSQATVSLTVGEWRETTDDRELFDRLVTEYPGPGGIESFWWSDHSLWQQADDLRAVDALISGDFAASAIHDWRLPERALGYCRRQVDFTSKGYVLATPLDYTLRLIVPIDRTLWATAAAFGRDGIADPVITAYDVLRSATTGDQDQAVAMLRQAVVDA